MHLIGINTHQSRNVYPELTSVILGNQSLFIALVTWDILPLR